MTEATRTADAVTEALEAYRFNEAASAIYRFAWNTFCDWYLELAKPALMGSDEAEKAELRATTAHVIDRIVAVLHPFMPFVTEELWALTAERSSLARERLLIHSPWPTTGLRDVGAAAEINFVVDLVATVRSLRSEANVPAAIEADVVVIGGSRDQEGWLARHDAAIRRLARASAVKVSDVAPPNAAQSVVGDVVVCLPLEGLVDLNAERQRLQKELQRTETDLARIDGRLSNATFLEKADGEVIEEQWEKRHDAASRLDKLRAALDRLDPAA